MAKYKFVVCGGTFDLLHKGHEALLKKAISISDKVLIGITSNEYVLSFKPVYKIEDFAVRKKAVQRFLKKIKAFKKATIVPINSAYEPYLETSPKYDAIVVSNQTKEVAEVINKNRIINKLNKLDVVVAPNVLARDKTIISSTRIRNGEIDRDGTFFINPKWENKNLILPENLRSGFQKPWGKVIKTIPEQLDNSKTAVVGDYTAKLFNEKNKHQFLSIIDFKIQREAKFKKVSDLGFEKEQIIKVENPAGCISYKLFESIRNAFKNNNRKIILISGEDDLAVLPVILLAPLGFNIFYGQPGVGTVWVIVSEGIKKRAFLLAEQFDIKTV